MPLPDKDTEWPPPAHAAALARFADYDAWYAGDGDKLARRYQARAAGRPSNRPSQYRGGVVGAVARWFWGAPTPPGERRAKVHIPLPADIATASADLLFADPPSITWQDTTTHKRWEQLDDDMQLGSRLHEAAEVCAPFGGVYLRAGWDTEVADHPLPSVVHADSAFPEFRHGRLAAVTFVRVLEADANRVVRYLERHEMHTPEGGTPRAVAFHGVYVGTPDGLGRKVDLGAFPETAGLEDVVDVGLPVLPVTYVPNMRPSREDRGSDLGRSDYEGVTSMFDALDETATSLMRDVRLGKARAFIPSAYLQSLGPGQGSMWDPEQEIYERLDIPPTSDGAGITLTQFAIRVDEHVRMLELWTRRAVETAGYSASTFGLDTRGGGDVTATEVNDRRSRSMRTRGKKAAYWGEGLRHHAQALMWVDRLVFKTDGVNAEAPPLVEWPDAVDPDPLKDAQTLQALSAAEAISTWTKVKTLHPEWDDKEVGREVGRILDEQGATTRDAVEFMRRTAATGRVDDEDQEQDATEDAGAGTSGE